MAYNELTGEVALKLFQYLSLLAFVHTIQSFYQCSNEMLGYFDCHIHYFIIAASVSNGH